jgi:bifunctional DNase/RNase
MLGGNMLIEMKVADIAIDQIFNTPIIILKDLSNKRSLPIWVGTFEAQAILFALNGNGIPRPLPYDIMKELLTKFELKLKRIIVSDLRNNTFYAIIELVKNGQVIQIDSRPSDAIALALRVGAPIMVSDMVIKKAKTIDISKGQSETKQKGNQKPDQEEKNLKKWLENLKPEDFGEYEM